ncbi:MAG: GNAT family N-acetyltransferase [Pseudomonadota bacterium]|jgi:GNAT superfamily N-acetyltransferase|nr:GNAT family N-acetyltransferase [Xanthomonadaceae bacterium]MDE3209182.1 GNAT family N-acetyltransferase [Pseudomonadota bacterium]
MSTNHTTQDTLGRSGQAPFGVLEGTHWIEPLNDGTPVLVRPLRADDRQREEDFINRLSPEARRHRFMDTFKQASPALLDQLMDVDNVRQMAFIALTHDNGQLREIGVSRYSATHRDGQCECAVAVADDWRHRGLALLLMQHLIDQARKNGFKQMISYDSAQDESMHELARHLHFDCQRDPTEASQVIHTLDL